MGKQPDTPVKKTFLKTLDERFLSLERIVAALFSSVLFAYIYQLLSNGDFANLSGYYNSIKFAAFFAIVILGFAALVGFTYLLKQKYIIPWALMLSAFAVSVLLAANYKEIDVYFCVGVGLADFIIVLWQVRGDKLGLSSISISRRVALIAACVLFLATTFIFGYYTSLKYRTYNNFTFDFGIFAQMYERMASSFSPSTTVERSYMMSHFGVHFSPIFYLFLPGYYLFRSPIYLFYIQSMSVAAGVFAVYLICGKLGFSGKLTLALELIYAFYPCLFNGTFYDFHENKFLTTIILFLFYFIISKKTVWEFVFAFLLLSVKEDAAIYLIVIALFVMINRKELLRGAIMLGMAVVYFIIAQQIVAAVGTEGVMMSRLNDYFINGEQTFGSVVKSVFFDFGFLLKQMFTAEKLPFILWMLAPVLFAPFMTKKISSLILLFPIVPINLMQSWKYQYDVDYQYTYGIAALVIISAIFVICKLSADKKRVVVLTSLCLCAVMTVALVYPKMQTNDSYMKNSESTRQEMDELIDSVPADATVTAAHSLTPHLYKVEWLYSMPDYYPQNRSNAEYLSNGRNKPADTDYFVIDTRYTDLANEMKTAMGSNYNLIKTAGFAELYQHK
ncbi:MAG: DUF2079 domain-containing protein [Ruminococcus sp.]|nr:DUF2079 domain-containing protein [Ruminococcus sp.]